MLIWQAHKGKIVSAAFAPDGSLFATATGGARMPYLWEPTSGKLVRKLEGADGDVQAVGFAPDAPLFAAGTPLGITVWRTDTWEVVSRLRCGITYDLAFGPGPQPMIAAVGSYSVVSWTDAGVPHSGAPREPDGRYAAARGLGTVHFSSDGTLLATSTTGACQLWRTTDQKLVRTLRDSPTNSRGAVRFSPGADKVALSYGRSVEVWTVAEEPVLLVRFAVGAGRPVVWAVHWTADGKALLTAINDGCVRLWEVPSAKPEGFASTGAELKAFDWKIGKLYCAAFSPDGLTCAACGAKGQVVIWDVDA
jgi:WD40 repeat protein